MTSARRLYRVDLALGGLGLAAVGAGAGAALGSFSFSAPSASALTRACSRWLPSLAGPELLVLSLGASVAVVFALALRSIWRQLTSSRRYLRTFRLEPRRVEVAAEPCRVVESPSPIAFCAGYLCPRVYLSRGSLQLLTEDELSAVVAHEAYHAMRFDPLRLLIARVLADALFFVPALRSMSERYTTLCELAADRAAVEAGAGSSSLASALLQFGEKTAGEHVIGISPERVDFLLGDTRAGRWQVSSRLLGVSALGAAGFLTAALVGQSAAHGAINLSLVVAQSCMLSMAIVSIIVAFSAVALVRRARRA